MTDIGQGELIIPDALVQNHVIALQFTAAVFGSYSGNIAVSPVRAAEPAL